MTDTLMTLWRLLLSLALLAPAVQAQPRHLYLTWDNEDTAHTQTIVFQTTGQANQPRVEVMLNGPNAKASTLAAKTVMLAGGQRRIHSVTLKGLDAATSYKFRAGDTKFGLSPWRTFRTLPEDGTPVNIAAGGDMYIHPETVDLLKLAGKRKPDVALIGGDIAYADKADQIGLWDAWFDNWADYMETGQGKMVPMICAIGNHEVMGAFDRPRKDVPFFFAFFPQGGQPYFVRRLNKNTEVVVLDTSHVTHPKDQVPFLEGALKSMQQRGVANRLALYHVPCYPTHRPYKDPYSVRGRQHWVPLFDKYELTAGLENHDHVFKRTYPLRGDQVVKKGTVYLGDGAWGRTPRSVGQKRPYNVKSSATNHFWWLTADDRGVDCQAINLNGVVFDKTFLKTGRGGE